MCKTRIESEKLNYHLGLFCGIDHGRKVKIYCATPVDKGSTFPDIQLVGEVDEMHLGMSRGPQVASSKNYKMVSAIDRKGDMHPFRLDHQSGIWEKTGLINDLPGSAPDGLMGIAADQEDQFYAVWTLDDNILLVWENKGSIVFRNAASLD
jgi:hypothetical protein